jgi:anti-anti-sigma regulatory factor
MDSGGRESLIGPSYFHVEVTPAGNLLLRGELDLATVQDLQDTIDGIMVPGQAIVLDLAQLTFLDRTAIHCFIRLMPRAATRSC